MITGAHGPVAEGGGGWAWVLSDLKTLLERGARWTSDRHERRGHGPQQRGVVGLEPDLVAHGQRRRRRHRARGGRCWRRGRRCRSGGTRPAGSTSWWPMARIAWRTAPRSVARRVTPNAVWADLAPRQRRLRPRPRSPRRRGEGVGVQPLDRVAVQRLAPEQDRLAEAEVVDPADGRGAEGPVEVGRVAAGHEADRVPEWPTRRPTPASDSSPMFRGVGGHAALAGQVGADAARRRCGQGRRSGPRPLRGRSGRMPSRRSPSSTMSTTPWTRPCRPAAASRALEHVDLGVAADVGGGDDPVDLAEHRRADEGHRRGRSRRRAGASMFSIRESPSPVDPGVEQDLRATSGEPRVALVTRGDGDAPSARAASTSVRALWPTLSRSTSTRGALIARRR